MRGKIRKESITTPRGIFEEERKRLIDLPKSDGFKEWLGNRSYPLDWLKAKFGETLTEKDGRCDECDCNVCGKKVNIDDSFLKLDFSCDEYSCGMNICLDCLKRLTKKLAEAELKELEKGEKG